MHNRKQYKDRLARQVRETSIWLLMPPAIAFGLFDALAFLGAGLRLALPPWLYLVPVSCVGLSVLGRVVAARREAAVQAVHRAAYEPPVRAAKPNVLPPQTLTPTTRELAPYVAPSPLRALADRN